MGEARRRKLAGTYPEQTGAKRSISRGEAITAASRVLAKGTDPTVSGVTVIPADGSDLVYLSADAVEGWPGGQRH